VFRGKLAGDFSDVKDWHWALISARGIPPASPSTTAQEQATNAAPLQAGSPPPAVTQQPPEATATANKH